MEKIINANNLEYLKNLNDNCIDAVVTDPPYGIAFMNKKWDYNVPSVEFWKEVYRVLKPGGHILSFGGTRTFHRLTVNIEDAGFDIRDTIVWHYGQGFPKSHNISKNLDKKFGAEREVIGKLSGGAYSSENNRGFNEVNKNLNDGRKSTPVRGEDLGNITAPSTDEAKQWDGWGTALKPATELICLAQKPISEKTIVDNVLRWGVGGLNIDGTRVNFASKDDLESQKRAFSPNSSSWNGGKNLKTGKQNFKLSSDGEANPTNNLGRWPANLILSHHPECIETDEIITLNEGKEKEKIIYNKLYNHEFNGSDKKIKTILGEEKIKKYICHDDCPLKIMDEQSGYSKSTDAIRHNKNDVKNEIYNWNKYPKKEFKGKGHSDEGGASRFFYCPKPSPKEKQEGNTHPTVKPIKLMEYLIKMVTPPNGTILDPFGGSGTTGIAAKNLNVNFILIEMDEGYCKIINDRLKNLFKDE